MREGLVYVIVVLGALVISVLMCSLIVKTIPPIKVQLTNPEAILKVEVQLHEINEEPNINKTGGSE